MQRSIKGAVVFVSLWLLSNAAAYANDEIENNFDTDTNYIPLDGTLNFRDLGGIETADGRRVKRRTLYRSDKLSNLTEADRVQLKSMKIRYIVDFRSPKEQEAEPDNLDALTEVRYHHLPLYTKSVPITLWERVIAMSTASNMGTVLVKSNQELIRESTDEYRQWFDMLLTDGSTPMIFHCSGGKDRTGLATALLLAALGVPEDTIFENYLATNTYVMDDVMETVEKINFYSLGLIDQDDMKAVMLVDRKYLMAAFDTIDQTYGNMENYLQKGLGLDGAKIAKLKLLYLTPQDPA